MNRRMPTIDSLTALLFTKITVQRSYGHFLGRRACLTNAVVMYLSGHANSDTFEQKYFYPDPIAPWESSSLYRQNFRS